MFYSPELLSRNGPLALVWQAAHSRGGLPEARMKALPLLHQVEQVLSLQMQVYALPLRAKLLLGCSRVYASKASLLLKDSSRTLDALRSASDSRSSSRQRPASQSRQTVHTAPEPSINLPQDPSLLQLFQLQFALLSLLTSLPLPLYIFA
jgi:cohesin complex subunit SCC1